MTRPKKSLSISDLINGEKIEVPYEEEVEDILAEFFSGRYDNMAKKIEAFELGQWGAFKYIKIYLSSVFLKDSAQGHYEDILRIFGYKKMFEIYYHGETR
jgi:hypothetical protein